MKRLKQGDQVMVIAGKDKGVQGEIIALSFADNMVKVKGVAFATRHLKARKQGEVARISKDEAFIHISNVMPIHPDTRKPCRINKLPNLR